jgi:hypothetical protein
VPRCLSVLPGPLSLSLPFVLCKTGHLNANLNYLAISRSNYRCIDGYLLWFFLQKLLGVQVYTHVL